MLLTPDSEVADVIMSTCLLAGSLLLGFRHSEHAVSTNELHVKDD